MTFKQKKILVLVSMIFLAILFIFFLILPIFNEIENTSKKILEIKSKIVNLEKRAENLQNFKKKSQEIKEKISLFESSFVDKEFPIDFITFLENTAKNYQILSEITLLSSGKDFLSFQIKAVGAPQNIFRFFEKIENCHYLVQVEKITLSKVSESELKTKELESLLPGSLKLNLSLKVQTK